MLLKTGTYTDGGGFGRVGDQMGVGATWRKFQSCGVWASFPDVGVWGDMFLSYSWKWARKGGGAPPLGISSPPKGPLPCSPPLPQSTEALSY